MITLTTFQVISLIILAITALIANKVFRNKERKERFEFIDNIQSKICKYSILREKEGATDKELKKLDEFIMEIEKEKFILERGYK